MITHSDVAFSAALPSAWFGAGVIDQDPLFVNPALSNYRLQAASPCVDAADDRVIDLVVGAPTFGPGGGLSSWNRSLADIADVDRDGNRAELLPLDLDLLAREIDQLGLGATGLDFALLTRIADMGCYENQDQSGAEQLGAATFSCSRGPRRSRCAHVRHPWRTDACPRRPPRPDDPLRGGLVFRQFFDF